MPQLRCPGKISSAGIHLQRYASFQRNSHQLILRKSHSFLFFKIEITIGLYNTWQIYLCRFSIRSPNRIPDMLFLQYRVKYCFSNPVIAFKISITDIFFFEIDPWAKNCFPMRGGKKKYANQKIQFTFSRKIMSRDKQAYYSNTSTAMHIQDVLCKILSL